MQKKLKVPEKARKMIDYLQENIYCGSMKQGERIPTLRVLKEKFDISLGTAKRGIDYLCAKKVLKSNHGSGVFVAQVSDSQIVNTATRIMVLMPWINEMSDILNTIYSGILEQSTAQKTSLILSHVRLEDFEYKELKELTKECSALILLGEYDMVIRQGLSLKMPVVACGMHSILNAPASLFEMDPFQSAELAVEYFKKNKISHVKCFTGNSIVGMVRLKEFKLAWEAVGGTVEYQQFTSNDDAGKFCFAPNGALLFASGWLMEIFCRRSKAEFNLNLAENATILGLDGRNCVDPFLEAAPTIYTDWKQIGRDIYLECIHRIKNPGITPRRYYYPVELIEPKYSSANNRGNCKNLP